MGEIGKKHKKYLIIFWAIIIVPIVSLITIFSLIAEGKLGLVYSFEELENPKSIIATRIISADSVELGTFYYSENRSLINYPDISPYMVDAIIAIEDMRYWKHSGIDFRGLPRVIVKSVLLRQNKGGGSTITQQLAKMLLGLGERKKNIIQFTIRKFSEWIIAVKLERSYTKEEILAMYLNKFDFLNNAVGVRTAARVYFNTTPDKLNIEQSAMLAAMHKNPSQWNPLRFEEKVLNRRNLVLKKLLEYGYIEKGVCDSLLTTELELDYQRVDHKLGLAPAFIQYLRHLMTMHPDDNNFEQEKWDNNPLYGWCNKHTKPDGNQYNIYRDGLKIYTTIDSRLQKYAKEAVVEHLRDTLQDQFNRDIRWRKFPPFDDKLSQEEIDASMTFAMEWSYRYRLHNNVSKMSEDSILKIFNTPIEMKVFSWNGYIDTLMSPYDSILYHKSFLRAGLISMIPQNGHVKAYVGSIDFEHFQYDHINSGKYQVGSIFKPFLYTLAYENGYSPCTEVPNVKVTFNVNVDGVDTLYTPKYSHTQNWDGKWVPLKLGLAKSLNQISAWIMREFNPYAVIDVAQKMGVRSYIYPGYPLCVGAAELKLSEITRAFSTFANKGFYVEPVYVTHIEDKNGNVLDSIKTKSEIAISEITAYKMLKTMEGVTLAGSGTGRRLRREPYLFDFPIAGKTGTTNDNSDGWFVGITPDLITGVWTGGEDKRIHFSNTVNGNALGQGANMALPVYALLMQKILADSTINILLGEFEAPVGYNFEIECAGILREQARKRSSGIIEDEEF